MLWTLLEQTSLSRPALAIFLESSLVSTKKSTKNGLLTRFVIEFRMHLSTLEQGRFSYDGLKRQRLTQPMARGDGGKLAKVDWQDALTVASDAIAEAGDNIAVVVGPFADVETMCLAKDLANKAGSEMVTTEQSFIANGDLRADYTFNSTIAGIEEADRVIIIG